MKLGRAKSSLLVATLMFSAILGPLDNYISADQITASKITSVQTAAPKQVKNKQKPLQQAPKDENINQSINLSAYTKEALKANKNADSANRGSVDFSKFIFLSDLDYLQDEKESYVGYGNISKNTNPNGGPIQLLVNQKVTTFGKGMGAHADSSLVYDIGKYSSDYDYLSTYVGIDYSQKDAQTDGVQFKVLVSNDLNDWKVLKQTDKLLPTSDAVYLKLNVKGYKYLRLQADKIGNNNSDHAVWGDLRLLKDGYDITKEHGYTKLKTLEQYDELLAKKQVQDNYDKNKQLILQRELVNRLGYENIQALSKTVDGVSDALDWLLKDKDALELLIEAGNFFNGNGYNATVALGRLYKAHHADLGNSGDAYVYKKMMLATVAAYSKNIKTFLVNYGGNANLSDPVVKYEKFKWLYDHNRFVRKDEFKTYPMELVRYVLDAKMDDSEILWLSDKLEKDFPDRNSSKRLSGYTYVRYISPNYGKDEFYDAANKRKWDDKYNFSKYGISYGQRNLYRLWMLMENGGICWGISNIGINQAEVQGIPAVNTYQPQHEAYLVYKQNDEGKGIWELWNNIFGWKSSYSRWGSTAETQARLLLGWGDMDFNKLNNSNNTTYILLAQAALNDYAKYKESLLYSLLANSYPTNSAQQIEAYNNALAHLNINLDAIYGLINAYQSDANTSDAKWLSLAKKITVAYTYYPAPMVDLLDLIKQNMHEATSKAQVEMLKTQALKKATQATNKESLQADACKEIANDLLNKSDADALASFSFDGDNAGSIVLNKAYDSYQVMTRVSLDGGKTWEKFGNNDYTDSHVIKLNNQQLAKINATDGITVGLVGTTLTSKIAIQAGKEIDGVYLNDQENLLLGNTANLQYSLDNGESWQDYDGSLASSTRFTGDKTVQFRRKAYANFLQGPATSFTFKNDTDTPDARYIQLKNVLVDSFSSEETKSADNAAKNFIDGNLNTAWHTKWNEQTLDKYYTVKFTQPYKLTKLVYKPAGVNGRLQAGEVYISQDGQKWQLVKSFAGLANDDKQKVIALDKPQTALYVKLVATKTYGQNENVANWYFSGSMLDFYEDSAN